jgi:adenine/guanine phosphoribosyltransferase-like PRPP-binding protein
MYFIPPAYKRIYNPEVFSEMVKRVTEAMAFLQKKTKFDAIAFSGSSGACMAYPVAANIGAKLLYVRRKGEASESHGDDVEAEGTIDKYIIVDDFVSSGSTIAHIYNSIDEFNKIQKRIKCVGLALYQEDDNLSNVRGILSRTLKLPRSFGIYKV